MYANLKIVFISILICGIAANNTVASPVLDSIRYDFIVALDGSGDFKSIQDALNAVPDFRKNITSIFVKDGFYKEKLLLPTSKINVNLVGESKERTVISFSDYASMKNRFGEEIGTSATSTFFVFADDFTARNLTFENAAGAVGQAVAVRVSGDRVRFINCNFLGNQDTLYPQGEKSRQYYKDCYIEGTVDFIFGWSTALFENCTIFCKKGKGYITAASTLEENHYGFVFVNCKITGDADENTYYLGRPWRPYAKTVFINCFMDKQIRKEGWHNWDKPDAELTAYYAEGGSKGPGANAMSRVKWSHQLNDAQLAEYTFEKIMRDWKIKPGN
jgi:pectinesterase